MEPFPDAVIELKERNIKLSLAPSIRTTPSPKTGAIIREVKFSSKRNTTPTSLLSIKNCFILGKKAPWIKEFQFLEKYNQKEGVLIISIPQKAAELKAEDENGNIFAIKNFGVSSSDLGDYAVVQCNIGRTVRYLLSGESIETPPIEKSGKVWPATLLIQAYTAFGTLTTGNFYSTLKFRIIQVDLVSNGKLI